MHVSVCLRIEVERGKLRGRDKIKTYNPSPSSPGSEETSNVIHPSGRSSVTARTSCRSPRLVPARTESAAGV